LLTQKTEPAAKALDDFLSQLKTSFTDDVSILNANGSSAEHPGSQVKGIRYDSRLVEKGDAFFWIEGQKQDGNTFIQDALKKGASVVISEKRPAGESSLATPFVVVPDVRLALAKASDYFFDRPSTKLRLIGVTGTNGKTTTTHMVEHLLEKAGKKVGLIGTLGARWTRQDGDKQYEDLKFTTPQASDLQELLASMVSRNLSHVAMEVSSHALALKRVDGCQFASACLTNITQDHLDFHKTMDHYWKSKRLLFSQLSESIQLTKAAVINLDDALAPEFIKSLNKSVRVLSYGWNETADVRAVKADFDFSGTRLELATPEGPMEVSLKLNGVFNVYNAMAALAICINEGIDRADLKEAIECFEGVAGRFEIVRVSGRKNESLAQPLCLVDYAHTPDGLDNVLKAARKLVPPGGKLFVVFGCGGDRDNSKRPQMGEIAESLADQVFVTSDNPRTEDPQQIIADILAGIKRMKCVKVEPDRSQAIHMAIDEAGDSDVILVAGKGHETYQILADKTIHFDDREVVRKALTSKLNLEAAN